MTSVFRNLLDGKTGNRLVPHLVSAVIIAVATIYALRTALVYNNPVDFKYIWAAGRIWSEGGNPYLQSFSQAAGDMFGGKPLHRWMYSPHSWALSYLFSRPSFPTAALLWAIANIVLNFVSAIVLVRAMRSGNDAGWFLKAALLYFYATVMIGGTVTISTGQYSSLMLFGLSCFLYAMTRERPAPMVAALTVLTMKASLGLPFLMIAVADRRFRKAIVLAGLVSLALAAPALLIGGPGATVGGYLDSLANWGVHPANSAPDTTGIRNLAYMALSVDLSGTILILICSAALLAGSLLFLHGDAELRRCALAAALALMLFLLPLHVYDLVLACGILALVGSRREMLWYLPFFAVLVRPNILAQMAGIGGSGLVLSSLALLGLLVVSAINLSRQWQLSRSVGSAR